MEKKKNAEDSIEELIVLQRDILITLLLNTGATVNEVAKFCKIGNPRVGDIYKLIKREKEKKQ